MTKADQIRRLLKDGIKPKEIAFEVGTTRQYVYGVRGRDRRKEEGKRPANSLWRLLHKENRNMHRALNYKKGELNVENKRTPYTVEDDRIILEHRISDREISKKIGRSVRAIQIRRSRLKVFTE